MQFRQLEKRSNPKCSQPREFILLCLRITKGVYTSNISELERSRVKQGCGRPVPMSRWTKRREHVRGASSVERGVFG